MREKGIDKYENAQTTLCAEYTSNNVVAKKSREGKNRNLVLQKRSLDCQCWESVVVRIQSALCEVACEQNSSGLKIAVVKIHRTIVSA